MSRYPSRVVRAPMLMARVYQNILERLAARGWAAPRRPVRVGRARRWRGSCCDMGCFDVNANGHAGRMRSRLHVLSGPLT